MPSFDPDPLAWLRKQSLKGAIVPAPNDYDPDAIALFARMTTPPSSARKAAINLAIVRLKAVAVWSKLDALWVFAAADAQAASLNWVANQYNCSVVGTTSFTADVGYAGDGSTGYLETGFNPTTAVSPKFVQNSGAIGFWSQTSAANDAVDMGSINSLIRCRSVAGQTSQRINSGTSGATALGAATDGSGLFVGSRTGPLGSDSLLYRDAVALTQTGAPAASAAPGNGTFRVLGRFDGTTASYSVRQCSLAFISSGLTAQNVADFYAIFS